MKFLKFKSLVFVLKFCNLNRFLLMFKFFCKKKNKISISKYHYSNLSPIKNCSDYSLGFVTIFDFVLNFNKLI